MSQHQRPWSQLANARYIDWVISSLRQSTELWARGDDWKDNNAWQMAWQTARDRAHELHRTAIRQQARAEILAAPGGGLISRGGALDAISALVSYDDSCCYMNMNLDELRVWAQLSHNPAAILLIPYTRIRTQTCQIPQS